jgi:anti-anti-sigma factor
MSTFQHLELLNDGPIALVRLVHPRLICDNDIEELTKEWNSVADGVECRTLLLDCSNVKVLCSEMLSKLIGLQRRLKQKEGKLILCGLRPEIRKVLDWTRLDRIFLIREDVEQEAAASA